MILKGKIVTLRPVEFEDNDLMREMMNDPGIECQLTGWALPVSKADQERWYAGFSNRADFIRYMVEVPEFGTVGATGLCEIDYKNGSAAISGMKIAKKDMRGRGVATDVNMTLLRFAFDELRLHRVETIALASHQVSCKALLRCGFKIEGVRREAVYKNGKYNDVSVFGALADDYYALIQKNGYWN